MFQRLALSTIMLAALAAGSLARGGDEVPAWLTQAAAQTAPAYPQDVPAVVLLNDRRMEVAPDGRITTTTTYAVRVIRREGRDYAAAREVYLTDTGKVRELKAWLVRPSGQTKKYGKDETVDFALEPNDIYNEYRYKAIIARDDAEPGAIFGYQSVTEDRSLTSQESWNFQTNLPALDSRFTLALPAGWRAADVTFNHEKVTPVVAGSTYTWQLKNLPPIPEEAASPAWTNIVPRLAVSYFPAEGAPVANVRGFANWADVSRWVSELADPQADTNDALATKALQLIVTAKTELEKIQSIARFVQSIQYISIDINVGRGGGIRPRPATQVLAKNYGDCKDKANLMRAMLKAVGIKSYLVAIYLGDANFVREEWAYPHQFNHCIIAVKVSDETKAPTVIAHPKLGRLLIFDATDDSTPVGDLPDVEQNSLALVVAGEDGGLVRMPTTPPEANRLERTAEVALAADGSIAATLHERSVGSAAVGERRAFRGLSRPEYAGLVERWITRGATGAKVSKVEPADDREAGRFALDVDFTAASYGQLMQGRLLVFKPAIVSRREFLDFTGGARKHPVVLESQAFNETVSVKLPAGFDVDELPDAVKLDAPFGNYSASYEVKDGQLRFNRSFVQRASTIPADQYAQVRGFFERIRAAEQSPVVLAKK
ncbi:MAG TPA: DUF3857 domain-containing protein [Pyrinomonadaceae bacterium]|jgi:hypothetical protein|nr:DUF3857 domain-containing protein [Pyrinomonadaceae bacterium]